MQSRFTILLLCACSFLSGCIANASERMHMGWKFGDEVMEGPLLKKYSENPELLLNPAKSTEQRNEITKDLLFLVDAEFAHDMEAFYWGRGQANFLADVAVIGLNTAGAVVGGESIKSILAATSAAVVGTKAKFNEEFFRDKATEALVLKMETLRNRKKAQIISRLDLSLEKYPLRDALIDVQEYFNAGTLIQAMVEIVRDLAPEKEESEEALEAAEAAHLDLATD